MNPTYDLSVGASGTGLATVRAAAARELEAAGGQALEWHVMCPGGEEVAATVAADSQLRAVAGVGGPRAAFR